MITIMALFSTDWNVPFSSENWMIVYPNTIEMVIRSASDN